MRKRLLMVAAVFALFVFEWVCIFVIQLMIKYMLKTLYWTFRFSSYCDNYEAVFGDNL